MNSWALKSRLYAVLIHPKLQFIRNGKKLILTLQQKTEYFLNVNQLYLRINFVQNCDSKITLVLRGGVLGIFLLSFRKSL